MIHAALTELSFFLEEGDEASSVDLTLLEVGISDVNRWVVKENLPNVGQTLWYLLFLDFTNRFERAVLFDEFETGLGSNALDSRVEVRAYHYS